ncbi:hypothetical protein Q5M87_07040 [Brachyspira innocens]|uniref:Uncharacterized protein n=1 Tax=Brachyspira innocens TaxID=13264 RepID=A0ABT8YYA6_9SPIR|nr:hypothetical protein [Brachyspira innocens]MDO6993765.1 hypothetical protein [Brachyspira innocens]MDO7020581.1 hypothetical protein [Brachyspira innocens]
MEIEKLENTRKAISEFLGKDIDIKLKDKELILSYKDKNFGFIFIDDLLRITMQPIHVIFSFGNAPVDFYTIKELADIFILLSDADKKIKLLEIVKENYIEVFV